MEKGLHYKDFPDVCVVFISEFDMFRKNRTLYHVRRIVEETNDFVENGTHEVYVNTAINDGSDIAELMQYFINSSGYHDKFKAVCNRVNYLKEVNEGVNSMSSVIEEYAQQYHEERVAEQAKAVAIRLLKEGASVELVAKVFPSFSIEDIKQLQQNELVNA